MLGFGVRGVGCGVLPLAFRGARLRGLMSRPVGLVAQPSGTMQEAADEAQVRHINTLAMIRWIRTSRLSINNSLSK